MQKCVLIEFLIFLAHLSYIINKQVHNYQNKIRLNSYFLKYLIQNNHCSKTLKNMKIKGPIKKYIVIKIVQDNFWQAT